MFARVFSQEEIVGALDFLNCVYGIFGFTYEVRLSTRPEQYLGEIEVWDRAEKALEEALDSSGIAVRHPPRPFGVLTPFLAAVGAEPWRWGFLWAQD